MLIAIYSGFISSFLSILSKGLLKKINEEEKRIKEQIAIKGGKMKLKKLTFLFNPNLNFLEIILDTSVFFIIIFGDSFN